MKFNFVVLTNPNSYYNTIIIFRSPDPHKLQEHLQSKKIKSNIHKIYERCLNRSKSSNYKVMVKMDRLNENLHQLETTNEDLIGVLMELQQDRPNDIIPLNNLFLAFCPFLSFVVQLCGWSIICDKL